MKRSAFSTASFLVVAVSLFIASPAFAFTAIDLGTLPGTTVSLAYAVNDHGQVVGTSGAMGAGGTPHAFIWQNGKMTDLGVLSGGTYSTAVAINNLGQVV